MPSVYAVIRASALHLHQIQREIQRRSEIGSLDHFAGNDMYNLLARLDVRDSDDEIRVIDAICSVSGVFGALVLSRVQT